MSTNLNPPDTAARHAIDARLDTIDRALLGLLPRPERIEIVAQIETRLREAADNPPVDDVLNDIARDRADRQEERMDAAGDRSAVYLRERPFSARRPRSRLALSSGILGIVALALLAALPVMYVAVKLLITDELLAVSLLGGHLTAVVFGGLLAVALGVAALVVLNRHGARLVGHGWAMTGLCTGPLPTFIGLLTAVVIGYEYSGVVAVAPVYTANNVPTTTIPSQTMYAAPQGEAGYAGSYNPYSAAPYAEQPVSNSPWPAPDAPSPTADAPAPASASDVGTSVPCQ